MKTGNAIDREQFERDGFVNGGPVLSKDEVDELREELERVIREQNDEAKKQPVRIFNPNRAHPESPVWQIVNIWQASPAFRRLMEHPAIAKAATAGLPNSHSPIRVYPYNSQTIFCFLSKVWR